MREPRTIRRRFLRAVSAAGLGSLAGCSGSDDGTDRTDEPDDSDGEPAETGPDDATSTEPPGDDDDAVDPELVAGIERRAVPLDSVDPEAPLDDLEPVARELADARIVGMGEATHGTWEFHAIRHRLVRKLVADHGFRVVAFEENFGGLRRVDEYVRYGQGDLETAMTGFQGFVFNTDEVRNLIEWLRAFNEGRPEGDRVGVYGIDMQSPATDAERVRAYFQRVDPDFLESVEDRLDDVIDSSTKQFDKGDLAPSVVLELAAKLRTRLEDHRDEYVSATSRREFELARRHVRVIEQGAKRAEAQAEGTTALEQLMAGYEVREEMMAENVGWILEFEDASVAFWAHNSHVQRGTIDRGPDGEHSRTQGDFVDEAHGAEYYPLGLAFGSGTLTARGNDRKLEQHRVDEPAEGTVAEVLVEVGYPEFFLDFDAASEEPVVAAWLDGSHEIQRVGNLWPGNVDTVGLDPHEDLDGLVFVRETTATSATDPYGDS